jgi:hypothetical protein
MRWFDWCIVAAGLASVVVVIDAAMRTFVVPRSQQVIFTYAVFRGLRIFLEAFAPRASSYERRDRVMALYAPLGLLALPVMSLAVVFVAFSGIFFATTDIGWRLAVKESGSSLFTLGFDRPSQFGPGLFVFLEAAIGLGLLAVLIAYLPTIYGAFSRRELMVTELAVRAGTPPKAWEFLQRGQAAGYLNELDPVWERWMFWFAELAETHTSLGALTFFRSPKSNQSWITAAGVVLDSAALRMAVLDLPFTAAGGLCIRSGFLALRDIASYFGYEYDDDPRPDDPICVTREEFDAVYDRLAAAHVPVKSDRDQAWRDFAGWRVNYDAVLVTLAGFVMAPYAPWVSDRSPMHPLRRVTPIGRQARRLRQVRQRSEAT